MMAGNADGGFRACSEAAVMSNLPSEDRCFFSGVPWGTYNCSSEYWTNLFVLFTRLNIQPKLAT
jgi:hypothetical protein